MASASLPRSWKIALASVYVGFLLYGLLVVGSLHLALVVPTLLIGLWYIAWRLWRTHQTEDETRDEPRRTETRPEPQQAPVERLKQRYAAGKITDEEFERKMERLLGEEQSGGKSRPSTRHQAVEPMSGQE